MTLHVNNFPYNSPCTMKLQHGSTFIRRQWSDCVVLVVTVRRQAEGEGTLAAESAERSEHAVRHVIHKHPGADQYTSERHFS